MVMGIVMCHLGCNRSGSGSIWDLQKLLWTCHLCCRWLTCKARLGQMEAQMSMPTQCWMLWGWSQ